MTEAILTAAAPAAAPVAAPAPALLHRLPLRRLRCLRWIRVSSLFARIMLPHCSRRSWRRFPRLRKPVAVAEEPPPADVPEIEEDARASCGAEEDDFLLEPEAIVTPELLSQMVTDNPEFGKLLETDSRLKGQLYKTAREAAELKPYREIFPDLDSARAAQDHSSTWMDVRETFLGSTSREGTMASLSKIAELSYERDADGQVVMQHGKPVIGEDFFGFVDNVVDLDLEHRAQDVTARLKANQYRNEDERARDQRVHDALALLREDSAASPALEAQPDALRRKADELDRRERALNVRQHGEKVEERRSFESGLQTEAQTRIHDGIRKLLPTWRSRAGWSVLT